MPIITEPTEPDTVTITFTQKDIHDILSLFDAAVRAAGLDAAKAAAPLVALMEKAAAEQNKEKTDG